MIKIDVLTYCTGYPYEVYERFVGSLIDTGYTGNIYIFCAPRDDEILQKISKNFPSVIPYVDVRFGEKGTRLCNHRFVVYKKFLESIKIKGDYLLLCDSRDVLFQKNIEQYEYDTNNDIYVFEESKLIKDDETNTRWLKSLEEILNIKFYEDIKHNKILCCGTTVGKVDKIKEYVTKQCEIIEILKRIKSMDNLDQGIHNLLFYTNRINKVKYMNNKDGLVNTMELNLARSKNISLVNKDNQIVTYDNLVSYIVHQYDRMHIDNKKKLSTKYDFTVYYTNYDDNGACIPEIQEPDYKLKYYKLLADYNKLLESIKSK